MSSFYIKILDSKEDSINSSSFCRGVINIESFRETFKMCLKWWSQEDYEQQWIEGIERLYTHKTSCLVASVQLAPEDPLINRWILYLEEDTVFLQNHMIFQHIFKKTYANQMFTLNTCYNYISDRRTIDEDGYLLLEHQFKIQDLAN